MGKNNNLAYIYDMLLYIIYGGNETHREILMRGEMKLERANS